MRKIRRLVRWVAIALNLIATAVLGWALWQIFGPVILDGNSALESIYANPILIAAALAPVSALVALLWADA
jgi:hypothetical protein